MPSTGLLPFLPADEILSLTEDSQCQCPQRAYFHFYKVQFLLNVNSEDVSMPSTGLLPFLLHDERDSDTDSYSVNALNGLTSISTVASRNP